MKLLALAILRGFYLCWNEEPTGKWSGIGFSWTNISAASGEPHRAHSRCAAASSTLHLLICFPLTFPWGFSRSCCCQEHLPGFARAVKALPALLLSVGLHSERRNKRSFLFMHPILHPSPSLVRREIRIPGKSCPLLLQRCGAVLRPALFLIFAHICYVRASNSLSQIFQMQMFRQWTTSHIIWKHFFFFWTFVMDAVQNVKIEIAYRFFSRCFVVHRSIFV